MNGKMVADYLKIVFLFLLSHERVTDHVAVLAGSGMTGILEWPPHKGDHETHPLEKGGPLVFSCIKMKAHPQEGKVGEDLGS